MLRTHKYYFQVQQQLFTTKLKNCYFVVCAVGMNELMLVLKKGSSRQTPLGPSCTEIREILEDCCFARGTCLMVHNTG